MNLHLREVIEVIGVCDCGGSVRQIQVKKTAAVAALPQGLMSLKLPCNTAASVNAEPLGHLSIHNAPDGFIHQGQLLQTEVALLSSGLYGIRRSPSASEFHRIGLTGCACKVRGLCAHSNLNAIVLLRLFTVAFVGKP